MLSFTSLQVNGSIYNIPVHHQSSYHDLTPHILIYKWDGEVAYHINIQYYTGTSYVSNSRLLTNPIVKGMKMKNKSASPLGLGW